MAVRATFLPIWTLVFASWWMLCGSTNARSQEKEPAAIAPEHHPWARFPVGAWRNIRILEQTFDDAEQVTSESVVRRLERLEGVEEQQFSLEQTTQIEVAGQRMQAPLARTTLGLATGQPGVVQSVTRAEPQSVTLDGRNVEASVLEVVTTGEAYSVRTRLWYSPSEPPYLLRSISEAVAPASQETVWRRTRKVLGRNLPFEVAGEQVGATFLEEQHVSTKGTRHSILVAVDHIPGGIAARWTKETDAEGQLIRREVEELLDWGLEADPIDP